MTQQIKALTSTRAVAAIMVFVHHFSGGIFPFSASYRLFHSGNLAVSYFFVLSGFVLFLAHYDQDIKYWRYFRRRVARIVPLYTFALLLCIYLAVFFNSNPLPVNFGKQITYSALLIQSFFYSYPLTLNIPGWSVSVELFFYALFPLFLLIMKKNTKLFITFAILLFLASQIYHSINYLNKNNISDQLLDFVFFHPAIHINQFLIGMLGGYCYLKLKDKGLKLKLVPTLLFAGIMLIIAFRPDYLSYQTGLIAPLFMLLIVAIAIRNNRILNMKGFVFLGEISFGIYILQLPVYEFSRHFNLLYFHLSDQLFFYFAFGALLIAATICHYVIERPFRRWINPKPTIR